MPVVSHGDCWITPAGEYAVLLGYDEHATKVGMSRGAYLALRIDQSVIDWLEMIGPAALALDKTSDEHPWRCRSFVPDRSGTHVFFFYRRHHAQLFKLRWV